MRLATDRSVAACVQSVIKDYGKWTAGLEVAELGKTNKVRYGLQFEVNLWFDKTVLVNKSWY